jgi:malonyl CoA-acyl carrier protein transacylase
MERLIGDGFDRFVEVGPGKVLWGLMRAINPEVEAMQTQDARGVDRAVETLQGG